MPKGIKDAEESAPKSSAYVRATKAYWVPAMCEFMGLSTSRLQRTAGLMGRDAASQKHYGGLLWDACEGDPLALDLSGFSDGQGILEFDAEISDCAVHLAMA